MILRVLRDPVGNSFGDIGIDIAEPSRTCSPPP
jgi:hypothetical protein